VLEPGRDGRRSADGLVITRRDVWNPARRSHTQRFTCTVTAAAYDFIVVGAGFAGCAVAGRLATESSPTVLLIEAGGSDRGPMVRIPLVGRRLYGTLVDWADETLPEPGCARRDQRNRDHDPPSLLQRCDGQSP
jgi:hypothetical protein